MEINSYLSKKKSRNNRNCSVIPRRMEDKKAIKETLIIKGGGRPKITHFWSPNKGLREEEEEEGEEEEEKER